MRQSCEWTDKFLRRGNLGNARAWYLRRTPRRSILQRSHPLWGNPDAVGVDKRRWGVVQPVGHLTVNEDGGGSNPPAPANSLPAEKQNRKKLLSLGRRQSGGNPALPSAVHRFHVGVTHFLKIFRGQRGTEAATTVQNEFALRIRHLLFDVALDDAFSQVDRSG